MSQLALSDLFEYLCYRSTAIRNIDTFAVRGSTLDVRIRQAGRQAGWQAGRLAGWQAGRLAGISH